VLLISLAFMELTVMPPQPVALSSLLEPAAILLSKECVPLEALVLELLVLKPALTMLTPVKPVDHPLPLNVDLDYFVSVISVLEAHMEILVLQPLIVFLQLALGDTALLLEPLELLALDMTVLWATTADPLLLV